MKNNTDHRNPYESVEKGLPLFGGSLPEPGGVRTTSAEAYDNLKASGILGSQARTILKLLLKAGEPMSLQEISITTGLPINAVSGRVNELKNSSPPLLSEGEKRKCKITGRKIIPVGVQ